MGLVSRDRKFCVRSDDGDPPSYYLTNRSDGKVVLNESGSMLSFKATDDASKWIESQAKYPTS